MPPGAPLHHPSARPAGPLGLTSGSSVSRGALTGSGWVRAGKLSRDVVFSDESVDRPSSYLGGAL
jgi:hypothetical protein